MLILFICISIPLFKALILEMINNILYLQCFLMSHDRNRVSMNIKVQDFITSVHTRHSAFPSRLVAAPRRGWHKQPAGRAQRARARRVTGQRRRPRPRPRRPPR